MNLKNYGKNKWMSLFLVPIFGLTAFGITKDTKAADTLLDASRESSISENIKVGQTIDVKYTITPKPINAKDVAKNNRQKDIVLLIDTSGSMKYIPNEDREPSRYYNEKSRLDMIKEVANTFINKFDDDKVSIGLVEYSTYAAKVMDLTNMKSNNAVNLTKSVNALDFGGSTNIGDALRVAYTMLSNNSQGHDKYVVLMTDGYPEAYSINWDGSIYQGNAISNNLKSSEVGKYTKEYYDVSNEYRVKQSINGTYDNKKEALNYATFMGKKLGDYSNNKDESIKSFVVGVTKDVNSSNKDIAKVAKGMYYEADNENSVDNIYSEIQKIIESNLSASLTFEETFTDNIKVKDVKSKTPLNYSSTGNKISTTIDNVYYKLSPDKKTYVADPIELTVSYEVKAGGDIFLGKLDESGNKTSYTKLEVLGKSETKYFDEQKLIASYVDVNIEVSDSKGSIDKYDSKLINPTDKDKARYDKFVEDKKYKLLGDSYADIGFQGNNINFFQYQFVDSNVSPTELPIDNWKELNLNKESINLDIDLENKGSLTQRSYDVSHLPSISDESKWNNQNEVFKTPFQATEIKKAEYSINPTQYGHWENYIKEDGAKGTRWVTNSIFINNMFISNNYKEASKFWGYLKVPSDGEYILGIISDDGSRGYITIDGKTDTFVDMFKVQGQLFGTNKQVYSLKKDNYYPIHLEYFNWGGSAAFKFLYIPKTDWEKEYKKKYERGENLNYIPDKYNIPQDSFYPSKSTTPGEYTDIIFKGNKGIKLPTEPGKYYIAYKTGNKDKLGNINDLQKSGIYGPFIVEAKAKLNLTRKLEDNGAKKIGDEFKLNYTITPEDIPYIVLNRDAKPKDVPTKESYTVKDIKFQENFENTLNISSKIQGINAAVNGNKLSGILSKGITYNLIRPSNDITKAYYKAEPITFSLYVSPKEAKEYILEKENSILTYTDIDGANRESMFEQYKFKVFGYSDITSQGVFKGMNGAKDYISNGQDLKATKTMPITLAISLDIKSDSPELNMILSGDIEDNNIVFKKYELINGAINERSLEEKIMVGKSFKITNEAQFKLEKDKKYIIIYTLVPSGKEGDSVRVTSNIDKQENKILNINISDLPDLF